MEDHNIDAGLLEQLKKLQKKYEAMGQDLSSYLDGLLHSDYLTYWDYIHLDTLLSLQSPRTAFPDEKIFILYHQITELYFNLILHEQEQIINDENVDETVFIKHIKRINRYFLHLIDSFDVMIDGMDSEQFLSFRMALLPSSGFQSGQYRKIEINSTDLYLLTKADIREKENFDNNSSLQEVFKNLYWKQGATELASGKKTLTLKQFEKKYSTEFLDQATSVKNRNLRRIFNEQFSGNSEIREELRRYDHYANVLWPLQHLKSAARYLQRDPEVIKATGGTNWQKYLPPKNQMIRFFPELWTKEAISDWGAGSNRKMKP
jgi:tryptophan 2,3-dioxygenase